ncbi:hypothetical protein EVAR_24575_1 [Eumeta japonica]|uniref:Uncharacterized protein n=1 Tax=Eumeta variegata TaxID=151549 RepID=A0A4C1W4A9_EUMVA|nr:hypothetical protein EVAR_24575_1 [Eumeta japonica]
MLTEIIENLEQRARQCNLKITNLPDRRNEDLIAIVRNLGFVIYNSINQTDILAVHRVPYANPFNSHPKNIVVKLSTCVLYDDVLTAVDRKKGISTQELGVAGITRQVYDNEDLTSYNKKLLQRAKSISLKHEFLFSGVGTEKYLCVRTKRHISTSCDKDRQVCNEKDRGGVIIATLRELHAVVRVSFAPQPYCVDQALVQIPLGSRENCVIRAAYVPSSQSADNYDVHLNSLLDNIPTSDVTHFCLLVDCRISPAPLSLVPPSASTCCRPDPYSGLRPN